MRLIRQFVVRSVTGNCEYRSRRRSVSYFLIDHVQQRLSKADSSELSYEETHGVVQPVGCVVRAMRAEQDVFQLVKRMSLGQRLFRKYVQRSSFDLVF